MNKKTDIELDTIELSSRGSDPKEENGAHLNLNTALAYILYTFPGAKESGKLNAKKSILNLGYTEHYDFEMVGGNTSYSVNYDKMRRELRVQKECTPESARLDTNQFEGVKSEASIYSIKHDPRNREMAYVERKNYKGSFSDFHRTTTDYYRVGPHFSLTTSGLSEMEFCGRELYYIKERPQLTQAIASEYMEMIAPEYGEEYREGKLKQIPNGYVVTTPDGSTQLAIVYELNEKYNEQIRISRVEKVFPDLRYTDDNDGFRVTRYFLTLKDEAIVKIGKKDGNPALNVTRVRSLNDKPMEREDTSYKISEDYDLLTCLSEPLEKIGEQHKKFR